MGKKGKGKKSSKAKKGSKKGDGLNQREAFLSARVLMREEALVEVKAELLSFEDEITGLSESVDVLDLDKDEAIKNVLSKLHRTEKNLEKTHVDMDAMITEKRGLMKKRMENRQAAMNEQEFEKEEVLKRNREIEQDISEWKEYLSQGILEHEGIIDEWKNKIEEQKRNTALCSEFIQKQIDTSRQEANDMIEELKKKYRDHAISDAIRCSSPGALYEYRESEKLEKWEKQESSSVELQKKTVAKLQLENLELLKKLDKMRSGRNEEPIRSHLTLSNDFFDEPKSILPEIPKIRLSGRLPRIHSAHSSILI